MVDNIVEKIIEHGKDQVKKLIDEGAGKVKAMINEKVLKKPKTNSIGKVVVVGLAGQGKSNLINIILGKKVALSCGVEGGSQGVTKNITEYKEQLSSGVKIRLFDTPGIGDMDVKLDELKRQFEENFCNKNITAFLYVKRIDENRVDSSEFASIGICEACIATGDNALKHMIVVFTYVDKLDEDKKPEEVAKTIIKQYNEKVKRGNIIDKYVLLDINNPAQSIEKILSYLKQFEYKLQIGQNFLMDYAASILKDYNFDINCFNANMKVIRRMKDYEEIVKIDQICVQDMIKVGENQFEQVLTVSNHQNSLYQIKKIKLLRQDGAESFLEITYNHLIYVERNGKQLLIPSSCARFGDTIVMLIDGHLAKGEIVSICDGWTSHVVNIRTSSGNIIVNEILTSSYIMEDLGKFGNAVLSLSAKISPELPQAINQISNKIYNKFNQIKREICQD